MSRIISRMTRGRITAGTTKKVLVSITFGALFFISTPPPHPQFIDITETPFKKGSGGEDERRDKRLIQQLREDDEIFAFIQAIEEFKFKNDG